MDFLLKIGKDYDGQFLICSVKMKIQPKKSQKQLKQLNYSSNNYFVKK